MSQSTLRTGILILTALTGVIHLILGLFLGPTNPLFILNGIGYLVLLWALLWTPAFLAAQRGLIRWVLILYTILTFVLYFVFNGPEAFASPLGLVTKAIELLLVIDLFLYRPS